MTAEPVGPKAGPGTAGGGTPAAGDYLRVLHEAAELFSPASLGALAERLALGPAFGPGGGPAATAGVHPLDAAAAMSTDFLGRGGKFLRPFICLAAFDAVRSDPRGRGRVGDDAPAEPLGAAAVGGGGRRYAAQAAAVAIEIFHKASLVHDDIEDADQMRYGRPTLHVEQGIPAAVNAGDYLLGLGYRLIAALPGVDAGTVRDLVAILADAHVRLARGQGAELSWRDASDKRLGVQEALAIYGLKTSPAFEAALAMGIRLAGEMPADVGRIGAYALHAGTGFQVLNDLKDWEGDLENDRRAAGDLLGGRPTVMWSLAVERLSAEDADRLRRLACAAGRPGASADEVGQAVASARKLYAGADVFDRTAALVAEQRALAAAAAATCRQRRLRDVLEFVLGLAVPTPVSMRSGR